MKLLPRLSTFVCLLLAPAVWAQTAPITLTLQSYKAFADGLTKIVDSVSPGSASDALEELREGLGIQDLNGIDQSRPWQVAVWADSISTLPCVSVRVPVSDFTAFKDGLDAGFLKGEEEQNKIQQVGNYATVWMELGAPSAATQAGEKAWKPEQLKESSGIAELSIKPGQGLREELVNALGMGRMMVSGAMAGQDAQALGGMDPMAMASLMGLYFDVIETGVKGFESFGIKLDLKNDSLMIEEIIVPISGSTLAGWFQASDGNLGTLSHYLNEQSPMSFAMRFEANDSLMPTVKKLIALSMQMQGLPADSEAIRDTEKLVESFLPTQFAGNVDVDKGVQFGGIYQFPGKDATAVFANMKKFLETSMQSQVGADKPYSSIDIKEGERKVDGVPVDRATLVVNMDAPLYQMPGQKEMLESLWPDGKMVFDYALKGKDLFMGTPEKLDGLMARSATAAGYRPAGVNPKTMAYGFFNVFQFIETAMAANPMMSDEDKEKLSSIDSTGTAVNFRVDLGDRLVYHANVPLKLFQTIGKLADD